MMIYSASLRDLCTKIYTEDQRDFLLRISIFREFTREQARFIRRKADPSGILDDIVEANSFIRLDARARIYHIHNLFADFLLTKLGEQEQDYIDEGISERCGLVLSEPGILFRDALLLSQPRLR